MRQKNWGKDKILKMKKMMTIKIIKNKSKVIKIIIKKKKKKKIKGRDIKKNSQ